VPEPAAAPFARRACWLLALVALPVCFLGLDAMGLIDPAEGRYAEIPREMLERGDFLTPTLNGVLYFEKPPLLYWLVVGAFRVFGPAEWAARLVPALSALLAVLVGWRLGARMFGERAGLIGSVILATNLLFAFMARALGTDMLFAALIELALALWWWGGRARDGRAVACDAGFWCALALAALTRGPVALVLVGGTIGLFALLCRRPAVLIRRSLVLTAPLLVLIAAPWFVLMSARHPGFDHFYWYEQHLGRFLGGGEGIHRHSWFYLLVWLPAVFFPWSLLVPAAMAGGWRRLLPVTTERRAAAVYLLGGALFIVLFFSASTGKVVTYLLPAIPLVALPLGAWCDRQLARGADAWRPPLVAGVGVAAGALALGALTIAWKGAALLGIAGGLGMLAGATSLAVCAVALYLALTRRKLAAVLGGLAGTIVLLVLAFVPLAGQFGARFSTQGLVEHIRPGLEAGARLVGYKPGICFYAQRRLTVLTKPGELHFGLQQLQPGERARWFDDGSGAVARQLDSSAPVYCVVDDHEEALELLATLGEGVCEIVWNKRGSILGNRAAAALTPPAGSPPQLVLNSISPPGRK
jgi:4-amino-4-deoxy-L-arabinose transferase-like glycosyltransferase